MFESTQKRLVRELLADPELTERVERLMTIPAVGEITALTWALEVGDPERFSLQLRRHKLLRVDGCMEVFGGQVRNTSWECVHSYITFTCTIKSGQK
jgi:hypothetical protein